MTGSYIDLDLCPAKRRILDELAKREEQTPEEFVQDMVCNAITKYVRIRQFGPLREAEPVKFEVVREEVEG